RRRASGRARSARAGGARGGARARRERPPGAARERAGRGTHGRSAACAVRRRGGGARAPDASYTALMPRPGQPYYVTTPIYYVNGEPHLGHAYTTIAADVATRHARRSGADAFLLTGTDEHGAKVQQAAAAAGVTPKQWADPIAERFRELARTIGAANDFFIRTTDP